MLLFHADGLVSLTYAGVFQLKTFISIFRTHNINTFSNKFHLAAFKYAGVSMSLI